MKGFTILLILIKFLSSLADDKSIAFVIDNTGSMSNDIAGAISGAQQIFSDMLHQDNSIKYFVLSTFNDPSASLVVNTQSQTAFLGALRRIRAHGGGDCPEMCMKGIKLAIQAIKPRSTVFVFTDASAKDYSLKNDVINLIQEKQCKLLYVLTGRCSTNPSDPGSTVYDDTAAASNGHVFDVGSGDVSDVIHYIDANFHDVPIESLDFGSGSSRTIRFPVDQHINSITLSLSGSAPRYTIRNPSGHTVTCTSVVHLANAVVAKCMGVDVGIWSLTVHANSQFSVRITGHGSTDYDYGFSSRPDTDRPNYRPLVGTPTYVLNKLSNFTEPPARATTLKLVQLDGSLLSQLTLTHRMGYEYQYVVGPIITPSVEFRMKIEGTDETGNIFRRITTTAVTVERNPCVIHPCGDQGTCHQIGSSTNYTCTCNTGYFGFDCSIRDACSSGTPCQNGATCHATHSGGYTCSCPSLYQGVNCEQANPCLLSPCAHNSTCVPGGNLTYHCVCSTNWIGDNCQRDDPCYPNPCVNGSCRATLSNFTCSCDPGFDGKLCAHNIDECESNPCENEGTCHDLVNGFYCSCEWPFLAPTCSDYENFTCVDRPYGDYDCRRCGWQYYTCHPAGPNHGKDPEIRNCYYQAQTFSEDYDLCEWRNVTGCAHAYPCPGTDLPAETTLPGGFTCHDRPDSSYSCNPCSYQYYVCKGGFATEQNCPAGLVFNEAGQYCDYPPTECEGQTLTNCAGVVPTHTPVFIS